MNKIHLKPPWVEYPNYERRSLGWRMGWGEIYLDAWYLWFELLDQSKRDIYIKKYPAPKEWEDLYKNIDVKLSKSKESLLLKKLENMIKNKEYPFDKQS